MSEDESYRREQERLRKMLEQLLKESKEEKSAAATIASDWADNVQLANLFRMSTKSVKRRTTDGTFKAFRIGGRYVYYLPDILKLKDRFMK